jgi:hypothetical protein
VIKKANNSISNFKDGKLNVQLGGISIESLRKIRLLR